MSSAISNILCNSSDTCVRSALRGLVAADSGLALVSRGGGGGGSSGDLGGGVLIRRQPRDAGKVRVLSGGGAGHEPAFAGFVGPGLLDAAVSGHIFASPTPDDILEGVVRLSGHRADSPAPAAGGVLVLIMNYTGDRLNFGLALARARTLDLAAPCRLFVTDDDAAVADPSPCVGRRGLAGSLFTMKLACAMADAGLQLDEIVQRLEGLRPRLATVGACRLHQGSWELGRGIHGEAGVGRIAKSDTAASVVGAVVDCLIADGRVADAELSQLAVLVNGLGGLSALELSGIAAEVVSTIDKSGRCGPIIRLYSANLMTSLSAPGFSVTALRLDKDCPIGDKDWIVGLLDKPAHCWPSAASQPGARPPFNSHGIELPPLLTAATGVEPGRHHAWPSEAAAATARAALRSAAEALIASRPVLNRLDSEGGFGDGDSGDTLHRGAVAAVNWLDATSEVAGGGGGGPRSLLLRLSGFAQREMGGTSGALLSVAFAAAAGQFNGDNDGRRLEEEEEEAALVWVKALSASALAVSEVGGASRGHRTLLDTVGAFLDAFADLGVANVGHAAVNAGSVHETRRTTSDVGCWKRLPDALRRARVGALATVGMRPSAGRAAYVGQAGGADFIGPKFPDPGAWAALLVLTAVCRAVGGVDVDAEECGVPPGF